MALSHPGGMSLLALSGCGPPKFITVFVTKMRPAERILKRKEHEGPQWMEEAMVPTRSRPGAQPMGRAAHTSSWPKVSLTLPSG